MAETYANYRLTKRNTHETEDYSDSHLGIITF